MIFVLFPSIPNFPSTGVDLNNYGVLDPDNNFLQITEHGEPTDAEEYKVTEPDDEEDKDYINNIIWEHRHFNKTRGVFNELAEQVERYDPNTIGTQTSPQSPLDNFLQPTQENHLVTPVKLFDKDDVGGANDNIETEADRQEELRRRFIDQLDRHVDDWEGGHYAFISRI